MSRYEVIPYAGKRILTIDFSHLNEKDLDTVTQLIDATKKIIQDPKNLKSGILIVSDITGSNVNMDVMSKLATFLNENKKYVKASALVGSRGALEVVKNVLEKETGRKFKSGFETREEAFDWLINQ